MNNTPAVLRLQDRAQFQTVSYTCPGNSWKFQEMCRKLYMKNRDNLQKVRKSAVNLINTLPGDYRKLNFFTGVMVTIIL